MGSAWKGEVVNVVSGVYLRIRRGVEELED